MMEKGLAAFRKTYRRRVVITCVLEFVQLVVVLVSIGLEVSGQSGIPASRIVGTLLLITLLITGKSANTLVLLDQDKLKEAYLEESDERNIAIRAKAGQPVVQWLSVGMLMVNCLLLLLLDIVPMEKALRIDLWTAILTLYVTAIVQAAISWTLKKYWEKRM